MKRYSFIGAGNMAGAIIGGMEECPVTVFDKNTAQYDKFPPEIKRAESIAQALEDGDYIFLAVKPQNFCEVLSEIKACGVDFDDKVFVSIAAGVKISSICRMLGREVPVIRTMPNTPLLIGSGVTALSRNEKVSEQAFNEIKETFSSCGKTLVLTEDKMNAVIAATSSAPAYIYYLIDCMTKEAVNEGMDASEIKTAICEMIKGSADMVMMSDKSPTELIKMVTSPNGTTERAMNVFYKGGFDEMIARAMKACTLRAEELSDELDK